MKPKSLTQRSSSSQLSFGGTPGDCGSAHTPTKRSGYSVQARWIRSLLTSVQWRLIFALPK